MKKTVAAYGDLSVRELLAIFISREIKDFEYVIPGAGIAVSRAGVLLARAMGRPNLRISLSSYVANLAGGDQKGSFQLYSEPGYLRHAEYCTTFHDHIEEGRHIDVTFVGAMQVDRYGNTNLIGIPGEGGGLRVRGPGSAGTATFTSTVGRYYIIVNHHNPGVIVENCHFRSTVGWDRGGREARAKLGLTGGGPKYVITPLCIMDFSEDDKQLRVKHLLPGATLAEVLENTGFRPLVEDLEPFPRPTGAEIETLRTNVDGQGRLRNKEE